MIILLFVALYPEMEAVAREIFGEIETSYHNETGEDDNLSCRLKVINVSSSSTNHVIHSIEEGDVLIARGGIVYDLKQRGFKIPVVEILITGSDLLLALKKAKTRFRDKKIAVIGSANMLVGIEHISETIGIAAGQYKLKENSIDEVHRNVEQAKKDGYGVIIGGTNGSKHAKSIGLDAVLIESGRESIGLAMSEAVRIARVSRKERQKALMYRTIIDSSYEGALVIDQDNQIILLNTAAQKILGLFPGDYREKEIEEILTSSQFLKALYERETFQNEILQMNNQYLSVNKVPLIMGGEQFGTVIAFQDITRIQEMESKIRDKIFSRGHTAKYKFSDIIGTSPALQETIRTAELYARNDSNILIYGDTGTGKELIAQSIHNESSRRREPFVAVNCAALSESLLESELFGYVEGAFTGALKGGKKGLFELAHNGTIFLDEISEISVNLQGRLLRVIQEQEVRRLGHDRIIPINVRVISASNRDLKTLIPEGKFREDLYYRLNIFKISTPPLNKRADDIIMIAEHFIREFCSKAKKAPVKLTNDEIHFLKNYEWPGNIRELKNICERLVALKDPKKGLGDGALRHILEDLNICDDENSEKEYCSENIFDLKTASNDREYEILLKTLNEVGGNKTKAAEALGISRVTLWRKMKSCGLD